MSQITLPDGSALGGRELETRGERSMTGTKFQWKPIEDLPADSALLGDDELRSLERVWKEQRTQLERRELLPRFLTRLRREWAIETGILERLYTLDRGVTETLIERGVHASLIPREENPNPEQVASMILDHEDVFEGLFEFVNSNRELSTSYIRELHAALTRSQPTFTGIDSFGRKGEYQLLHGAYKTLPNNPTRPDGLVHEYCPPEQTASEMDRLVDFHLTHNAMRISPEVSAAWLHHAFTQIHPFQDGNGRVARTLASLVLLKAGWFPLSVKREEKNEYIDALETADQGDLSKLTSLFAAVQRRTFVQALTIAGDVQRATGVDQVISAVKDLLERRDADLHAQWEKAKSIAHDLWGVASRRFADIETKLTVQLGSGNNFTFQVDGEDNSSPRRHYFREQVVNVAKDLDYFANLAVFHEWVRLKLRSEDQAEILLSLHGIGQEYRGLVAASLIFFRRQEADEGVRQVTPPIRITDRIFQINYKEKKLSTAARFEAWLDEGVVRGLEMWRKGL